MPANYGGIRVHIENIVYVLLSCDSEVHNLSDLYVINHSHWSHVSFAVE